MLASCASLLPLLAASGALADERPRTADALRPAMRVIRAWDEIVGPGAGAPKRRVEIIFDTRQGVLRRRVRDASGHLVSDRSVTGHPRPSPEEIREAFDLVRRDRELGPLLRRSRGHLDGGFLLAEAAGEPCGPGSRCLQVFLLSESRRELIRRAIVDLVTGRIAYRDYRDYRDSPP